MIDAAVVVGRSVLVGRVFGYLSGYVREPGNADGTVGGGGGGGPALVSPLARRRRGE